MEKVVGVQPLDVVALREGQRPVPRTRRAGVVLPDDLHAAAGEPMRHLVGAIARSIVGRLICSSSCSVAEPFASGAGPPESRALRSVR